MSIHSIHCTSNKRNGTTKRIHFTTKVMVTNQIAGALSSILTVVVTFVFTSGVLAETSSLKISQIEKNVSLDPTRPCIHTYNKHIQIHVRIHSTVNVIRARIVLVLSVLEGTQRVPPTCTNKDVPRTGSRRSMTSSGWPENQ